MSSKPKRKPLDIGPNVVSVDFGRPAFPPKCPADQTETLAPPQWNPDEWLNVRQLLERGWARQWLDMALGKPLKRGGALLWSKEKAMKAEKHPAFAAACEELLALAKRVRYVTKEDEVRVLEQAVARFKTGDLPAAEEIKIAPIQQAKPAPSEWPKLEQTADAITLIWPDGKVVVPLPFLEALRRGMGETQERLLFAINTVVTDWRAARARPEKLQYGRNYLLASIKNVLTKLQELERGPAKSLPAAQEPAEPPQPDGRVLH